MGTKDYDTPSTVDQDLIDQAWTRWFGWEQSTMRNLTLSWTRKHLQPTVKNRKRQTMLGVNTRSVEAAQLTTCQPSCGLVAIAANLFCPRIKAIQIFTSHLRHLSLKCNDCQLRSQLSLHILIVFSAKKSQHIFSQ